VFACSVTKSKCVTECRICNVILLSHYADILLESWIAIENDSIVPLLYISDKGNKMHVQFAYVGPRVSEPI
jgi:hypothetical protein